MYLSTLQNIFVQFKYLFVQIANVFVKIARWNIHAQWPNKQSTDSMHLPAMPLIKCEIYLSKLQIVFVQITSQRSTTIPLHGISLLFPSYFSFTNCNYNLLSISLQNLFWTCFPKWWQSLFFKLKFAIQFEFAKLHRYQKCFS